MADEAQREFETVLAISMANDGNMRNMPTSIYRENDTNREIELYR
jgi:hypothetical protein